MKQYLDEQQTAKLIELGFNKPKSISGYCQRGPYEYDAETNTKIIVYDDTQYPIYNYSIGELLLFLPLTIQWTPRVIRGNMIEYSFETEGSELYYCNAHNELIDNLFDMCVKLKKDGVI